MGKLKWDTTFNLPFFLRSSIVFLRSILPLDILSFKEWKHFKNMLVIQEKIQGWELSDVDFGKLYLSSRVLLGSLKDLLQL